MNAQAGFVGDTAGGTATRVPVIVWLAFAIAILSAAAGLVSGPGNRFGWWDYRMAFGVLRWAAWGGVAGAALSLAALVLAARRRARTGIVLALIGIVAGALTFGLPWQLRARAQSVPPIHDISTDTDDPPRFVVVPAWRKDSPNPVQYEGAKIASQQKAAYPDITALVLPIPRREAFDRCLVTATMMGWKIVAQVAAEGRIEATDTTPFFGFQDDVVVRVGAAGTGSRVDVRSVSRVGRSDLGTNAKRIREFLGRVREAHD